MDISVTVYDIKEIDLKLVEAAGGGHFYVLNSGNLKIFGSVHKEKAMALTEAFDLADKIKFAAQGLADEYYDGAFKGSIELVKP